MKREREELARELLGKRTESKKNVQEKFDEFLKLQINLRDFDRELYVKRRALEMSGTAGELGIKRLEITINTFRETRELLQVLELKLENFLYGMRIAKGYKPAEMPFHDLSIEAVNLSIGVIREKFSRIEAYVNNHITEGEYIKTAEAKAKMEIEEEAR